MYDDGYNRKKSRKRKRKPNTNKERKPKSSSRSKKEANRVYIQNMDGIKIEVKSELEDMAFEDTSQENDDFLVPQGNYNDSIIIENDPVDDPLKLEDDILKLEKSPLKLENNTLKLEDSILKLKDNVLKLEDNVLKLENDITKFEKPAKRRTQKSKSSEQKKPRSKPYVPKSRRKPVNKSFASQTSTSRVADATVQCRKLTLPDVRVCVENIANNQGIVSALPGNVPNNEPRATNDRSTIATMTTSVPNLAYIRKDAETLINNTADREATICLMPNIKNDSFKITNSSTELTKKTYPAVPNMNSGYQNENAQFIRVTQSTCTNYKDVNATYTEAPVTNNRKIIIKPPRLNVPNIPPGLSIKPLNKPLENTGENQDLTATNTPKSWSSQGSKPFPQRALPSLIWRNNKTVEENLTQLLPAGTDITQVPNRPTASGNSFILVDMPVTNLKTEVSKEEAKKFWTNAAYSAANSQMPGMNKPGFYYLQNPLFPNLPTGTKPTTCGGPQPIPYQPPIYPAAQITPVFNINAANTMQNTGAKVIIAKCVSRPSTKLRPMMLKRNTSRPKPRRENTRKKSSKDTKNKSSSNANLSETANAETQVNNLPNLIDSSSSSIFLPNAVYSNNHPSIEKNSPAVVDDLVQRTKSESSIALDNKTSPESLLNQLSCPNLSISNKRNRSSNSKRKPKEKSKKTTRKKELATMTPVTPLTPMSSVAGIAQDHQLSLISKETNSTVDVQPSSSQSTSSSVIPGHISDMILPNIPNSDLLKAFNNYWSAQISHCAVCATFALCSGGSSRMMPPDWKYRESIDLPENSPIWVKIVNC